MPTPSDADYTLLPSSPSPSSPPPPSPSNPVISTTVSVRMRRSSRRATGADSDRLEFVYAGAQTTDSLQQVHGLEVTFVGFPVDGHHYDVQIDRSGEWACVTAMPVTPARSCAKLIEDGMAWMAELSRSYFWFSLYTGGLYAFWTIITGHGDRIYGTRD
ncbi:hypothetical protein PENSPDRAFT_38020 [Peniophora sp. CONT]|nr:hypothetical protein PENSPDRAFT_38020 [Peniophora sp. CONT]